jgi:hypothetical protein
MDFKQFVNGNKILHLALVMGVGFTTLILYFVNRDTLSNPSENLLPFNENFLIILAAIPWIGSRFSYRLGITKAATKNSVTDKLMSYRTTLIRSCAIAEGPTMLFIILYFFFVPATTLLFAIGFGVISLLAMRPSEDRIIRELQLSNEEKKELNKLDGLGINNWKNKANS